ncbi:MAG TPA: LamG domain-containing protein [Verrucomicrobiae bacterium]
MFHILLPAAVVALTTTVLAADVEKGLVFRASFDSTLEAEIGTGDRKLYWSGKMELPPKTSAPGLPTSAVITHEKSGGVSGGYLKFQKKAPETVFFHAKGNMPYNKTNWNGTVSFWLKLTPDEDLEPGFTDPIQITDKAWNKSAFFVEFSKDEKPREFRLGVYADFEVWNPQNKKWEDIPMSEKPLAPVLRPPFTREKWTHVAFTFENFNTGKPNGLARLYLNGEERAVLKERTQTFTWDYEKALIMLGLSYVGGFDELAIYDRPLSAAEIGTLHSKATK